MRLLPASVLIFLATGAFGDTGAFGQTVQPRSMQIDVDLQGNVYLLNAKENTLTLLSGDLKVLARTGGPGWENGRFDNPSGVWARNGIDVFVADYGNHRIQRFDRGLSFISSLSTRESENPEERFGYPVDVAVSRMGDLFVIDGENTRIVKINNQNKVEKGFGGFDAGKGRLRSPAGLDIGPNDNVYVLDQDRIFVFDNFGNFSGELYKGMFTHPTALFADNERVMVLDGKEITCLDAAGRPVSVMRLDSTAAATGGEILGFAAGREDLYLLTDGGVVRIPFDSVDKKEKTR